MAIPSRRRTARVTTSQSLQLRDSPRDGDWLADLSQGTKVEVLGEETWMRVRLSNGQVGFVQADYVEPLPPPTPSSNGAVDSQLYVPLSERTTEGQEHSPRVFLGRSIEADVSFFDAVEGLERLAAKLGIEIIVTSSLREPLRLVENAVVDPAVYSNHHVGHAIDFNLKIGNVVFRSVDLRIIAEQGLGTDEIPVAYLGLDEAHEPLAETVAQLLRSLPERGLRWGGTFATPDPVHIDDRLNIYHRAAFEQKFAALWGERALRGVG